MQGWIWVFLLSPLLILGGACAAIFHKCGALMRLLFAYPACALFSIWVLEKGISVSFSWGRLPLFSLAMLALLLLVEIPFRIYRIAGWIESWRGHIFAALLNGILIPLFPKAALSSVMFLSSLVGPRIIGLCGAVVISPAIFYLVDVFPDY